MDIVAGISAAGTALSIAKSLKEIDKSYDAVAYKQKIIDLIDALSDAKLAILESKSEIDDLRSQLRTLAEHQDISRNLIAGESGYLYFLNEQNEKEGFPACPKCYSKDKQCHQLVMNVYVHAAKCPVCDTEFRPVTSYVPPSKNHGTETTLLAIAQSKANQANQNLYDRFAELNDDDWSTSRLR